VISAGVIFNSRPPLCEVRGPETRETVLTVWGSIQTGAAQVESYFKADQRASIILHFPISSKRQHFVNTLFAIIHGP